MKLSPRSILPAGMAVLMLCSFSAGQSNGQERSVKPGKLPAAEGIVEPTAKEALKALLANGDISMSSIKSCRSMKTSEDDRTILDYLSGILAFQAEPKTKASLEYAVKLIKGKGGVQYWEVKLIFKGLDVEGGDPWNNGFRFLLRTRDRRMVRGSLECIG